MIEVDTDKVNLPISRRERICIKLALVLIKMLYPAKWSHEMDKFIEDIKQELVK